MCRRPFSIIIAALSWLCFLGQKPAFAQTANSWTVPIHAQIGSNGYDLYLGIRPNATDGFDFGIDTVAAPPPPGTPYAYLPLAAFPNFLQADYRGTASSNSWSLRIVNTNGATSTVSWNVSQVPSSIPGLFIVSTRDTVNMRQTTTKPYAGDQSLKISFPAPVSVSSRSNSKFPELFSLRAYPNPFTAATTLVGNTPPSPLIIVRIFNLLGEEIRAFHQIAMPSSGIFQIHWDGLDANGMTIRNGIYFCKLEAQGVSVWLKLYCIR